MRDRAARFDAIDTARLLAPVASLLPDKPSRILDIGAGTGRDARWFARPGHLVCAVEPDHNLRAAARVFPGKGIGWVADALPALSKVTALKETYDLILVCAVWHILSQSDYEKAFCTLHNLLRAKGALVLSLRQSGNETDGMLDATLRAANRAGFTLCHQVAAASVQPANRSAGVTWVWLGLTPNKQATPTY